MRGARHTRRGRKAVRSQGTAQAQERRAEGSAGARTAQRGECARWPDGAVMRRRVCRVCRGGASGACGAGGSGGAAGVVGVVGAGGLVGGAVDMNAVAALLKIDAGAASARALREREFPDLEVALAADDDGIGSSVSSPELFDKGDGGGVAHDADDADDGDAAGGADAQGGSQSQKGKLKKRHVAGRHEPKA
mmetsp:Transcript_79932/g.239439  ORF Transcript_79932/g.239439 Transcript_79932/m.239439 type:complete len:192 (+) Transcript_79932:30-605(+)